MQYGRVVKVWSNRRAGSSLPDFNGQANGDLRVTGDLALRGQVAGDLIIEAGAVVQLYGQVAGNVFNRGHLTIYGMVVGSVHEQGGTTICEPGAVIMRRG